jgi:LemA protein
MIFITLTFIAILLVLISVFAYNRLIRYKNLMLEAWSNIDVQLKRRHDLIPKLLDVVKGYSRYERSLLEALTNIRAKLVNAVGNEKKDALESDLSRTLKNVFAVAENYPDLKANQSFLELQKSISEIEDQIQFARRYYNGAVRNYNIIIDVFPSNLIAMCFKFTRHEYFELDYSTERQVPDVAFS